MAKPGGVAVKKRVIVLTMVAAVSASLAAGVMARPVGEVRFTIENGGQTPLQSFSLSRPHAHAWGQERLRGQVIQPGLQCGADLPDDRFDRNGRRQSVVQGRERDPARRISRAQLPDVALVQRLPITTVDKREKRRAPAQFARGHQKIQRLGRPGSVGDIQIPARLLGGGFAFLRPFGHERGVLRPAGAEIVIRVVGGLLFGGQGRDFHGGFTLGVSPCLRRKAPAHHGHDFENDRSPDGLGGTDLRACSAAGGRCAKP